MRRRARAWTRSALLTALVAAGLLGASRDRADAAALRAGSPAVLDLSSSTDRTSTVNAAAVPLPDPADGIGPGSHLIITMPGGTFGCTANFVWRSGTTRYLGSAGHCFLPAGKTATAGPGADYNPSQTHVKVCVAGCTFGGQLGFAFTGTLVDLGPVAYARQADLAGQELGNDFGVVEIPSSLSALVRTSVPVWGGPTGATDARSAALKPVCHYGNGVGVGEVYPTKGRMGLGMGGNDSVFTAEAAASPGDSGSPVESCLPDANGLRPTALGILTTIVLSGVPLIEGTTVARAITMATEAGLSLSLETAA